MSQLKLLNSFRAEILGVPVFVYADLPRYTLPDEIMPGVPWPGGFKKEIDTWSIGFLGLKPCWLDDGHVIVSNHACYMNARTYGMLLGHAYLHRICTARKEKKEMDKADEFPTIAARWHKVFEATNFGHMCKREQGLCALVFHSGFAAGLDASAELDAFSDEAAAQLLQQLRDEVVVINRRKN